jgi:hypothetical protein
MPTPVTQLTSLARLTLERVARPFTDIVVAALIEARVIDLVVARLLEAGVVERVVTEVLVSPDTEDLIANTLERPELERLIVVAIESPATDRIVTTLLESDELQRVVEHIANSPEVQAAITRQSLGLATSVAGEVRAKSVTADDGVERIVRRVLRRRQREQLDAPGNSD